MKMKKAMAAVLTAVMCVSCVTMASAAPQEGTAAVTEEAVQPRWTNVADIGGGITTRSSRYADYWVTVVGEAGCSSLKVVAEVQYNNGGTWVTQHTTVKNFGNYGSFSENGVAYPLGKTVRLKITVTANGTEVITQYRS